MGISLPRKKRLDEVATLTNAPQAVATIKYTSTPSQNVAIPLQQGSNTVQRDTTGDFHWQNIFNKVQTDGRSGGGINIFANASDALAKPIFGEAGKVSQYFGRAYDDLSGNTAKRNTTFEQEQNDRQQMFNTYVKQARDPNLSTERRQQAARSAQGLSYQLDRSYAQHANDLSQAVVEEDPMRAAGATINSIGQLLPVGKTVKILGTAGQSIGRRILGSTAFGAVTGLPYGMANVASGKGQDATATDYALGAVQGAGTGAAFGLGAGIISTPLYGLQQEARTAGISRSMGNTASRLGDAMRVIDEAAANVEARAKGAQTLMEPPRQQPEPTTPTPGPVDAGNPYMTNSRLAAEQERARYDQTPVAKAWDRVKSELYDPRAVEQSYDNAFFKMLRDKGLTRKGQTQLSKGESLAGLRGEILNPEQIANTHLETRYQTPGGAFSVHDIIRHYGREDGEAAKRFANYRLFKDQVWRMENEGAPNSLPDTYNEMVDYIQRHERENPQAIYHNQAIRAHDLQMLKQQEEAGIYPPGYTEQMAKNPYYAYRTKVTPDERPMMKIEGGIRGSVKKVQARDEFNSAPDSSLSLVRKQTVDAVRNIANVKYGNVLKQMMDMNPEQMGKFKVVVDAKTLKYHKQMEQEYKSLANDVKEAKQLRDQLKKEKRKVTAASKAADVRAGKAKTAHEKSKREGQKELQERITKRENIIVKRVDRLLEMAKRDDRQILSDLATEKLSREEKLAIGEALENHQVPEAAISGTTTQKIARAKTNRISTRRLSTKLQDHVDALRGMVEQSRQQVKDVMDTHSAAYQAFRDSTQHVDTSTNRVYYSQDGEIGVIDIPSDLADSISRQNTMQARGVIEKAFSGVSKVQKTFWTGLLNPAWNVYNVMLKNPVLMFFNGDRFSGVHPDVWKSFIEQSVRTKGSRAFDYEMNVRGASKENAFQTRVYNRETADDIARRAGIPQFMAGTVRHPIRTLKDFGKAGNALISKLPNIQRRAVEYGAYKQALRNGWSEKEALDYASNASAQVFGDFDRVTKLAQQMEALIPYSGATQAGTRAMWRTARTRPVEAAAKATVLGAGMTGFAAYSIANAKEYYQDMVDENKAYVLDQNIVIAMPGAHKNADGSWSGIIQIPLVPDFRPMNRAIWRTVLDVDNKAVNAGETAGRTAYELFNQMTGDIATSVYDPKKGQNNPVNGVFSGSAAGNVAKTATGINTYDGSQLSDEAQSMEPRTQQYGPNTSETAKGISNATNGFFTPKQVDQLFNAGSTGGDVLQNPDKIGEIYKESFVKPFQPKKSQTKANRETSRWFDNVDKAAASIPDESTRRLFIAGHKSPGPEAKADILKNAKRVQSYYTISDGKFKTTQYYAAEKYLDNLQRKAGQQGNPLFDLKGDKLQKVLEYTSSKMLNQGKQSYDKNGNSLFVSLGLDEKWYQDYTDKVSKYYDGIKKEAQDEIKAAPDKATKAKLQAKYDAQWGSNDPKTFSGAKKPELTKDQQKLQDYYYTLPKGTGARSAFLKANPWLLNFWDASDGFTVKERNLLALKNDNVLNDGSKSYGSGGNGKGGSGSGYYKKGYAKRKGSSKAIARDPRQYAISVTAGGAIAKPKVIAHNNQPKAKVYKPTGGSSKPKLSLKKSKV